MPANTKPIYPVNPNLSGKIIQVADTNLKAPVTNGVILATAGENGTRIDAITVRSLGANVATVLRIFWNDGTGIGESNFQLIHEVLLPATTAQTANVTGSDIILLPINFANDGRGVLPPALKSGQKLYISLGTTVASGYSVLFMGGDF